MIKVLVKKKTIVVVAKEILLINLLPLQLYLPKLLESVCAKLHAVKQNTEVSELICKLMLS